jgi:hypothetical protein
MLQLILFLLLVALAVCCDMGYALDNEQWASAYEAFINATTAAAGKLRPLASQFTSNLNTPDMTSDVTPTTGWGVLFPLVWLWRTLPFWTNLFAILLIIAGFIWSPRGSHIVEALFNALRDFADLLKTMIPNPIDIYRLERAKTALFLAQHQVSVAERVTHSEIELREAANIDREHLRQMLEEANAENVKLERKNRTLRRPLDIETLQLRIRELNQKLYATTKDVNGKIEDASAPLRRQIDAVKKLLDEKEETIKLCHRSIARLEKTVKDTEKQSKLDKKMIEGLQRINRESHDEIKQLQDQVIGITKEANSMIASRDKRLETLDAIKELLHQMFGQSDYFEAAMTFAFLASLAEIDIGELEIDIHKLDFLMDCVENDISPTAEQCKFTLYIFDPIVPY